MCVPRNRAFGGLFPDGADLFLDGCEVDQADWNLWAVNSEVKSCSMARPLDLKNVLRAEALGGGASSSSSSSSSRLRLPIDGAKPYYGKGSQQG